MLGVGTKKVICLPKDHRFCCGTSPKECKVQAQKGGVKSQKQNVNFNPFCAKQKKSNESSFASFLQIENLRDHQQEEKSAALTHHKLDITESYIKGAHEMSESNSDVAIDLSNTSQNEKNISPVYSTSSEETLLNNNKTELSFLPISEKNNTIDSKIPQKNKKKN